MNVFKMIPFSIFLIFCNRIDVRIIPKGASTFFDTMTLFRISIFFRNNFSVSKGFPFNMLHKLGFQKAQSPHFITVQRQAILLLVVKSGTRKLRKIVASRTKFPFDVKRVMDSTTVLVLDSTPKLLQ